MKRWEMKRVLMRKDRRLAGEVQGQPSFKLRKCMIVQKQMLYCEVDYLDRITGAKGHSPPALESE
jgi:hypothetical protein